MISIGEALLPDHVNLTLLAKEKSAAIHEVTARLQGDGRILDWMAFEKAVVERNAPAVEAGNGQAICIAHGRTSAVSSIVMGVGRSEEGIICPETAVPVRLIFVAGIPAALSSDYLRLVGAIVRICRDASRLAKILSVREAKKFVEILETEENRLS